MMTLKLMAAVAAMVIGTSSVEAKQSTRIFVDSVPSAQGAQAQEIGKKVVCTRDNAGRVVSKIIYKWNDDAECWSPTCQYKATYGHHKNTLTYSRWSQSAETFKVLTVQEFDASVTEILSAEN